MRQILVYSDSLSWGIIPGTRQRFGFDQRWPGVMEIALNARGLDMRVIEDCLNGRRTVWEDPFKAGRNGLIGLAQRIEVNSPLALVILMLGNNDLQSMHPHTAWHAAQGVATLINAIRTAPLEPGMPVPSILVAVPPAIAPQPTIEPRSVMAAKFEGADQKCRGLAEACRKVCDDTGCHFFDAGTVTPSSRVDGVHLDADQHLLLGKALADMVSELLGTS